MIETRAYDVPAAELIEIRRGQVANLLFRNPNEPFTRSEVVQQPMPHKVDFTIGNTRELHRLQMHGLFQLWSSLVELEGIELANRDIFGTPVEVFNGGMPERDGDCVGK